MVLILFGYANGAPQPDADPKANAEPQAEPEAQYGPPVISSNPMAISPMYNNRYDNRYK